MLALRQCVTLNCRSVDHLTLWARPKHSAKHDLMELLKKATAVKEKREKKAFTKINIWKQKTRRSNDELEVKFPKTFFKATHPNKPMSHQLYLINDATAERISQHLANLPDKNTTFVETNPGLGHLTNWLLKIGLKDLRLFEGRKEFMPHLLQNYATVYPEHVKLYHGNLMYSYKRDWDLYDLLSTLPCTKWQEDINFRLFTATGSIVFFKNLIHAIVFQSSVMAMGRCELYIAMPSFVYVVSKHPQIVPLIIKFSVCWLFFLQTLTASTQTGYAHYRATSVLFQLFFEYQLLDKFKVADFLPPIINHKNSTRLKIGINERVSQTHCTREM